MRIFPFMAAAVAAVLVGACGGGGGNSGLASSNSAGGIFSSGLAACPAGNAVFTTAPVALENVQGWVPLGQFNPPGHTFPTDHQYLYTTLFGNPASAQQTVPVVAPADIRITAVWRMTTNNTSDYTVFFQPCADLGARFGHIVTLTPEIVAAAGPIDRGCQTYQASPGSSTTLCQSASFRLDVPAGRTIGTLGGGGSTVLDWWLQDRRIAPLHFANPARFSAGGDVGGFDTFHTVAASDYFVAAASPQVAAKVGRYDGSVHRTAAPLGGTIAVDVDGTARGHWFHPTQPYPPESFHAALAPDPIEPDKRQVFSLGAGLAGAPFFATFTPQAGGLVNRAFESVTADGNVHCYETSRPAVVLVQLLDAATLKLEVKSQASACAAVQPWSFGAGAVTYKR
ncbi:hypothetical protein [Ramlibacter sp. PS4R-6]|uniref:hypothetical protein n=1 Tax=Ramlibacter sp. PS4R-6 TaxID=3133438 RepID=UPI0030B0E880